MHTELHLWDKVEKGELMTKVCAFNSNSLMKTLSCRYNTRNPSPPKINKIIICTIFLHILICATRYSRISLTYDEAELFKCSESFNGIDRDKTIQYLSSLPIIFFSFFLRNLLPSYFLTPYRCMLIEGYPCLLDRKVTFPSYSSSTQYSFLGGSSK
jgi:hypothetical protein